VSDSAEADMGSSFSKHFPEVSTMAFFILGGEFHRNLIALGIRVSLEWR